MKRPRSPGTPRPSSATSRRPGRPSRRTPALIAQIADAIAEGLTNAEAAALAGIAESTLDEWAKLEEFSGPIKKAKAQRLLERLRFIRSGKPGWQAVAWILERCYGRRFANPALTIRAGGGFPGEEGEKRLPGVIVLPALEDKPP